MLIGLYLKILYLWESNDLNILMNITGNERTINLQNDHGPCHAHAKKHTDTHPQRYKILLPGYEVILLSNIAYILDSI